MDNEDEILRELDRDLESLNKMLEELYIEEDPSTLYFENHMMNDHRRKTTDNTAGNSKT